MSDLEVRKSIEIDASPEVVFKAISDPDELTNWFPDAAILEPVVGGKTKFMYYKDSKRTAICERDHDITNEGRVLEFVKNKKLVYTWQRMDVPDFPETIVTWELEEISKNKTRLTLTHTGFTSKDQVKDHSKGWSFFLNELALYLTRPPSL
ncbi:MAG: SRPBCC domain-containing protein [Thaumarchaeota archaeon]|nr:SRPBCC domain-containing protein [Nitrososphaerota archaeon]